VVSAAAFGIRLALGAARRIGAFPASIPPWAVIVSLATACGAGLVFGNYPAARASRLDPVEAMRSEEETWTPWIARSS
jgi:putative ABC transport system permease protein